MKRVSLHVVAILSGLIMAFQNCSPVAFTEVEQMASLSVEPSGTDDIKTCSFDGRILQEGDAVTAFLASSVPFGEKCDSESRVCKEGALSGSYSYTSCDVGTPKACLFNGQTIAHGANVTAFQNSAVAFGGSCNSEVRACDNGVLSGSFAYGSCDVGQPAACLFNGQTLAHGETVKAFQSSSVEFGKTCSGETRVCNNGALSGSYTFASCAVGAPKSCLFNGRTLAHLEAVTAYAASSVEFGKTCSGESRVCNNGVLSGSFGFASCAVGAPKSCLLNGATIAHGQSVKVYKAASAAVCEPEDRVCNNGVLSGSYTFNSCEVPCTLEEKTKYLNTMIQIFANIKNEEIAENCIDDYMRTLPVNMPTNANSTLRFKNTCGNRYCQDKKGMASGRVIDMNNGYSTLECRYDKTPSTYTGTCVKEVEKNGTPMDIIADTRTAVLEACEPSNPNSAQPYVTEASTVKYFYTCGYRYCVSKGYADGRIVELSGNYTEAHCYRDMAGSLPKVEAPLNTVGASCMDAAYPTMASVLPGTALQIERYQSTCGNRYCIGQGYSMGHVVEYNATTAVLRCLKK